MFDQFRTTCPDCGGDLWLIGGGFNISVGRVKLESDGFSIGHTGIDTFDEVFGCKDCGGTFDGFFLLNEEEVA